MSEEHDDGRLEGKMYLYERPEPLTVEAHGELGLRAGRSFAFAAAARVVPIAMTEFRTAQRHFPIIFTSADEPRPLAMVGLEEGRNLFVDADGRWDADTYVPAYLRCYPFALANTGPEQYALVIDRSSDMIVENPAEPFFAGREPSPSTRVAIDLCQNFRVAREQTEQFCARLRELDLLTLQQAGREQDGAKVQLARYYAVDPARLENLDHETLSGLMRDGSLAAIMAHLFSMDNWTSLVRRHAARVV
jgi:hypothetical protein